jgi:UDP:flavonoid glycosyltransferase YjiC (YdhE family)
MRVLATTHPGSGHLHPLVPLLRTLSTRGHAVLVTTSRAFCPAVEAVGLQAVAVGHDWLESDAGTTLPGFLESSVVDQVAFFVQLAGEAAPDIERVARDWHADLILREYTEYGGWIAAERLGLPHVECGITMAYGGAFLASVVGEHFARLLDASGLPPDPELERATQYLYLDFLPPSFTPDWAMPPRTRRNFRPEIFDASGPEHVPPWWDALRGSGRPILYVTLGTVFNQAPQIFDRLIDAVRDRPVEAVMTVGRNVDPRTLGPTPVNVQVERYIPQSAILRDCAVVVCHGGCNTILAALAVGAPLVCIPLSADQPVNAARCEALGIGKSVANDLREGARFKVTVVEHLTPGDLWESVQEVLQDDRYRQAVQALQSEMLALPGIGAAVDAICAVQTGRA